VETTWPRYLDDGIGRETARISPRGTPSSCRRNSKGIKKYVSLGSHNLSKEKEVVPQNRLELSQRTSTPGRGKTCNQRSILPDVHMMHHLFVAACENSWIILPGKLSEVDEQRDLVNVPDVVLNSNGIRWHQCFT
jgi:hypothetical protein